MTAAAMLLLWLLSQTIQFSFAPVYANLYTSVTLNEGGYMLLAAMWLVLNNATRAVLLYGGWFMLSDGVSVIFDAKRAAWVLPPLAIPVSYFGMSFLHFPSVPHFGVPALITLVSVWLLQYITSDVKKAGYKFAVQAVVVFSIQWLDLIPVLTPYGFGWGELSYAIKHTSLLMEKDHLLNMVCMLAFAFSSLVAMLLTKLFVSYEKQLRQLRLLRLRERELTRIRTDQARMRLYQEMQYLVHDLKRPLTTVLGLSDLLSISKDASTASHGRAIAGAAEKMEQMIGEIKYPDRQREATVGEIVDYTMAQVRGMPWGSVVSVEIPAELRDKRLCLNVIRFSRVLVNLLDNAWHATESTKQPLVSFSISLGRERISFIIEDNGPGFIEPVDGEKSGWGSSGLGLAFVKEAIAGFHGDLAYEERSGGGVRCLASIPVVSEGK
ncbi:MAG: HAMP domain-containing sensor histidine kinase [bacterium]|nr:HAMP domain-containing sensor histidine kinase [bacterium]